MNQKAYFVRHPRCVEELRRPHRQEDETPYQICRTITLSSIDFENFAADLLADRAFIEQYGHLCRETPERLCLLVQHRNAPEGILVLPERTSFVKLAAYIVL